ncbi:MAG TPA: AAA family ATPase [Dictyobacter sp.]|nr:AAA family ATPase [Dictyobacter sp.]
MTQQGEHMSMTTTIFIIGTPGSGKSTAARYIRQRLQQYGRLTRHVNDYTILYAMFLEDIHHRHFQPTSNNGFDAIDLSVLDIALHEVEKEVERQHGEVDICTIEFARDDYQQAIKQFTPAFLRDAHVLFIDSELETCLQRVHHRVNNMHTGDDHPSFSDDIFRQYYRKDNRPYILHQMRNEFHLKGDIIVIENKASLDHFLEQIEQFISLFLPHEVPTICSLSIQAD